MDDGLTVALRFGLRLDLMLLFGLGAFALWNGHRLARGAVMALAIAGAGLSLSGLWAQAASMAGVMLGEVDRTTIGFLLADTSGGWAWLVRMNALAVMVFWPSPRGTALWGAVALATLAWGGHGVMNEGALGWLHLGADILHLLAAGLWIGALATLLWFLARARSCDGGGRVAAYDALAGFARLGTIIVGLILITGLINGWAILGPSGTPIPGEGLYGRLMTIKLALFAAMLGLAALNRFRLVPAFAADGRTGALRVSVAVEAALGITILLLVAWLGMLSPAS
ncbi:putative copper resistance protein D [Sphingomonas laterariae]|uniref:Putative copper resistance protein D n=1 Tax=Edaphosphingomonas laterariae TaxID=861865 RepID=A0A239BR81_9SPHN|nr:copper homeostasis membrane protein CopD [Sphingomonas laterariae]SNS09918.1 putative copper resistance protein D [Sphingomonas laterariae]